MDLKLHIRDILQVIRFEDLSGLTLVGHSYGGTVATGVADRARDRIERLVYLDAFVPTDGQSVFDLLPEGDRHRMQEGAATTGDGWRIPPNPVPPDTLPEDLEWIAGRRLPRPIEAARHPLRMLARAAPPPRTYIYCTRTAPSDPFGRFAAVARDDPRWRYIEIDASHKPHITAPETLARVLVGCTG